MNLESIMLQPVRKKTLLLLILLTKSIRLQTHTWWICQRARALDWNLYWHLRVMRINTSGMLGCAVTMSKKYEESGLESQEQETELVLRSVSAIIASLERLTVQKLRISNEAKDWVKQGTMGSILARVNVKSLLMIWMLVIQHESGIVPKCYLHCNRDDETRLMSSDGKVGDFLWDVCNLLSISGHESEPWCSVMSSRLPLRWQPFGQSRMVSSNLNIQDIDNDHSDPQMCHGYIRAFAEAWS